MKKFNKTTLILCGLLLIQAAFPVFAQDSEPVRKMEINKKPIQDLGKFVKDKVDLTQPFKVVLDGKLIKKKIKDLKGNEVELFILDPKESKWDVQQQSGNPEILEIVKKSIESISDNGFFGYFYNAGIKNIKITLEQNDKNLLGILEFEQKTKENARTLASMLNMFLTASETMLKNEDEKLIANSFKPSTTTEKSVILNFEMPKETVKQMIKRHLATYKEIRNTNNSQ